MDINTRILNVSNSEDEKILRRKTAVFDFKKYSKKEIDELVKKMRSIMEQANGVGLAANQIGLDLSVFVAKIDNKFYAIFNPEITSGSKTEVMIEEGCLSIPGRYSRVYRDDKVVLKGFDKNGKEIKIKAWGILARVFEHEVDHLQGKLFTDRLR